MGTIDQIQAVRTSLQVLRRATGLRVALVARIAEGTWTLCAVLDDAGIGFQPGDTLALSDTYWNIAHGAVAPLLINCASADPRFTDHPVLARFGIESYLAVPLFRADGQLFGTLCALDTVPADLTPDSFEIFQLLATLIGYELEAQEREQRREVDLQAAKREIELRERFIGVLGHDLRTPLTAIATSAQLLRRRPDLDERGKFAVDRIIESSGRMARMIAELTDFTRGGIGGGLPLSPAPADLLAICRRVVAELEVVHPDRDIVLRAEGDARGVWDADRLAQVVSNLLANALQYSPAATPITVELTGGDGEVTLRVQNAGDPIPAETLARIFDPFERGTRTAREASAVTGGLGLGLFIVRHIVEAHGGEITVHSTADEGTTFEVRLPRTSATEIVQG